MRNTQSLLDANIGLIALGAAIAALGIAVYHALMMEVRLAESRIDEVVHVEADFQREIGYGGLIHNYKNFLVRGAETHRAAAIENHRRAVRMLVALGAFAPGAPPEEFAAVRRALDAYRANLDVIAEAHRRGLDIREIDRRAGVDDSRALQALGVRVHEIHKALEARREALREAKWRIFIAIGTFLAALAVVALMLARGVSRRIRLLEQRRAPTADGVAPSAQPTKARSIT
jgi:hypothetical protein